MESGHRTKDAWRYWEKTPRSARATVLLPCGREHPTRQLSSFIWGVLIAQKFLEMYGNNLNTSWSQHVTRTLGSAGLMGSRPAAGLPSMCSPRKGISHPDWGGVGGGGGAGRRLRQRNQMGH